MMKVMGAGLAVCSIAALVGSSKPNTSATIKKSMIKTADKVADFVDSVAGMM